VNLGNPGPGSAPAGRAPATLSDYLDLLWRRRLLLGATFALVLVVAAVITARTRPLYEATTTIMVEPDNGSENLFAQGKGAWLGLGTPRLANHVELLRSRSLAEQVAARLPDSIVQPIRSWQRRPDRSDVARALQEMVSARPIRETDVVLLRVLAPSPAIARYLANSYAEVYRDYNISQSRADISAVRRFIDGQLSIVAGRLDSSELALEEFKTRHCLVDLDAETRALIERRSAIATLAEQTSAEVRSTETQLAKVGSEIEQENQDAGRRLASISSPLVTNLKATLDQLEVEHANLLIQGYPDSAPRVQSLARQKSDVRARLDNAAQDLIAGQGFLDPVGRLRSLTQSALDLRISLAAVQARDRVISTALADYDARLARLPGTERALARLTRDVEIDRNLYSLLTERDEQAKIQEAGRISPVRTIDLAAPARRVRPNLPASIALALALALSLSFGLAFAVDYLDTTVHSAQDAERLGCTTLATVPLLPATAGVRFSLRPPSPTFNNHVLARSEPASPAAEAFRMLRTSLAFAGLDRTLRTIVVTSAGPGEGKSLVATNLAIVLAQSGRRTLLVDADLRRPVLHSIFHRRKKPGLTDVVLANCELASAIFPGSEDRLYCLPSGTIPPSPADVLNSPPTATLFQRLAQEYDHVVIDSPPVLVAADTPILASRSDATLFVVRAGRSHLPAAQHALAILRNAGARLVGTVLNGAKHSSRHGRYYYYRYRYAQSETAPGPRTDAPAPLTGSPAL
jgi:tyrosine-protein kinase Etk/Wzc